MTDYLVGKKGDYTTFQEAIPHLEDGDIVTFKPGLHSIVASDLKIKRLTLQGIAEKAYEKTTLVLTANPEDPKTPAFHIEDNGGLEINRLSIVVAPTVTAIICGQGSTILMDKSNLVWNHFKLKSLTDNQPLIITDTDTTVMHAVDITESVISSVDLVSRTFNLDNTALGSVYGSPSYISGFTKSSTTNYLTNVDIGLVGELYSLNVLGDCQIVDTNETLVSKYPNLEKLPLTITNLLFNKFDPKAVRVGNTWDKTAESLYTKRQKSATKIINYYLTNLRAKTPVYLNIEPKGKGRKYPIPHDKSLINNEGTLILTGENNAQTTWPNTQTKGLLVLTNYLTNIPYRYIGGDVVILNSRLGSLKNETFTATKETTDVPLLAPRMTEDYVFEALQTPEAIAAEKAKLTPIYDNLLETFEHFALEDKIEMLPIVLIGSNNFPKVVTEIDKFSKTLASKQVLAKHRIKQITGETLSSEIPTSFKEFFIDGLGGTWLHADAHNILNNKHGDKWIQFAKLIQNMAAPQPPTLIVYTDTPENLDALEKVYPIDHVYRYDVTD